MDVLIRFAQSQDIEALISIWHICFGDDTAYIRSFIERCFHADNTIIACIDDKVVGVAYMLPATLSGQKFMYGYAVGVLPEYRGNAICEKMHLFIKEYAEKENFIYGLHPANEKLFSFYRKIGLRDMYALHCYEAPKEFSTEEFIPEDVTVQEYEALRRNTFSPLVEWDREVMEYILLEAKSNGGFVKKIAVHGKSRLLIGKKQKGDVIIKETTMTDEEIQNVTPFLYRYFEAKSISYILPNHSNLGKKRETILGFGKKDDGIYMNLFLD